MDVSLVINPIAGNRAFRFIKRIEDLFRKRASLATFITKKRGDAFAYAREVQGTELIVVAGGDGTFNEVINGLLSGGRAGGVALAFLPLGTTNVLAKELGIPEDIEKAVQLALTGTPKKICLGRINGRYFSLMAGIGFDGETVYGVRGNLIKKISGKGAYILSGIKTLFRYSPPPIRIRTPGKEITGYTAIIGKASCYGGYFRVTPKASLTEPVLDLCVFTGNRRRDFLRYVIGVVRKRHLSFTDVVYEKCAEIEATSPGTVHIQIDGDYFGTLPARIDVVPDAISLIW